MEEVARNVHLLRMNLDINRMYPVLWLSDLHWDNPKCDRALLKRHLDEAMEHNPNPSPHKIINQTERCDE